MADFFAIKGAVVDIVSEALPDYKTTWGFTTRDVPRKWAYIGELSWPDGEWATNRSREYVVTVPVILNGIYVRLSVREAETALAEQVRKVVAAFGPDSVIRDQGVISWTLVPRHFGSQPYADGGIEAQAALELRVTYRP